MKLIQNFLNFIDRNKADIVMGSGLGCTIAAVVATWYGSKRSHKAIAEAEKKAGRKFSKKDKLKLGWKYYIPAGVALGGSLYCQFKTRKIHKAELASVTGLYSVALTTLETLKEATVEEVGENKAAEIDVRAQTKKIQKDPEIKQYQEADISKETVCTGHGADLFYESLTGTWFRANLEFVRSVVNDFNTDIIQTFDSTKCANDYFDMLGIGRRNDRYWSSVGWDSNKGILKIKPMFVDQSEDGGENYIYIDYESLPIKLY